MKCTYYSCYMMGRDVEEKIVDAEEYKCKWRGDAVLAEFSLHKAARCVSVNPYVSVSEFIWNIYEALDMPSCKNIKDYHKPYTLEGVKVFPTSNLYGATNPNDGVYEIDGRFYTIGHDNAICTHPSWESAFNRVFRSMGRYYLCGKNYSRI